MLNAAHYTVKKPKAQPVQRGMSLRAEYAYEHAAHTPTMNYLQKL